VARALDLRLNGRGFKTRRPLALPGSNLGQVTHTYWPIAGRSCLVRAYLAAGEITAVSALITTTIVIGSLGHGLQHLSCSARSIQPSTFYETVK